MGKGNSFNYISDIYEQLPFFCCYNKLVDSECQKDIAKYIYCKETNTPPYEGAYSDTPSLWIEKYYIIKTAMAMRDNKLKEKMKNG